MSRSSHIPLHSTQGSESGSLKVRSRSETGNGKIAKSRTDAKQADTTQESVKKGDNSMMCDPETDNSDLDPEIVEEALFDLNSFSLGEPGKKHGKGNV